MKRFIFFLSVVLSFNVCAQRTIFFDIDQTLCWSTQSEQEVTKIYENYPELTIISDLESHPGWFYIFLPHIRQLFDYLISIECEIHFFSAGGKERNEELVPMMLAEIYSARALRELRRHGNFRIFSFCDMMPALIADDEKIQLALDQENEELTEYIRSFLEPTQHDNPDRYLVKSLAAIFPDRDLDDMLLVDDLPRNSQLTDLEVSRDGKMQLVRHMAQQPQLIGFDEADFVQKLSEKSVSKAHNRTYQNMAFFCGMIMNAHEYTENQQNASLRQGLAWCYRQDKERNPTHMGVEDFISDGMKVFSGQL